MSLKPVYQDSEKRAAAFEKEVAQQWERAFDALPDLIMILDQEHRVVHANKAMAERLGCTAEELAGQTCYQLMHGLDQPPDSCPHVRLLVDGAEHTSEMPGHRLDGYFLVSVAPLRNRDGKLIGSIHVARDITDRKEMENALRRSKEELSIMNRIAEIFAITSDDETYGDVLEVFLEAMHSQYGTFAYINENGDRVVPSMTRGIWDQCKVADKDIVFPRETWGNNLWARCLVEQKTVFSNGPFKVPEGHLPITRALAVPIIHRGEVTGNFMVANKASEYDEYDVRLLERIAAHTAPILHARLQRDRQEARRKRAEDALKMAHQDLERRVEERTAELKRALDRMQKEVADRRRAEAALRQSQDQLRRLSAQLLTVQEDERKRISRELHDSTGQSLAAIKFGLENAMIKVRNGPAEETISLMQSLVSLVQEASAEVRRIHTDLRPSLLDDLGILATVSWFCREFQKIHSGIRIEKRIEIEEKEVPEPLKIVMFRLLQEALNNVAKHSQASVATIFIRRSNGTLELLIEDNGEGFDTAQVRSGESPAIGVGIGSMKERVELSDGSFFINSTAGKGTLVGATWEV